ncbi:ATP-binding protein [Ancylothrix sp. C2]|uniref:hybrid sensor histidine kinase/response regulator n=1 Tax=Ancylothrix sp. D3o TaxID=2953691 RepID=UPI0021BAFFEF|nr:GAF domain-containing hybrid sensor histidine kinase/response regulator [Ancylothrix sp. D3o]MCT7951821.1 ATP-binding protein [Ancylothrix sp. D3o]
MPTSLTLRRNLPLATFERLRLVLRSYAERLGRVQILSQDILATVAVAPQTSKRFMLVISPEFSGLVLGIEGEERTGWQDPLNEVLKVEITFDIDSISGFIGQLKEEVKANPLALAQIEEARKMLQPSDSKIPGEIYLELMEILVPSEPSSTTETGFPCVSVCQPVEEALGQQLEQERLLNQVTSQIRQSLELPEILSTAVEQVRRFLQVDRLLIYQFDFSQGLGTKAVQNSNRNGRKWDDKENGWGRITYESRLAENIPSVLNLSEEDVCFIRIPNFRKKYCKGFTQAIEDTKIAYSFSPCFLDFMDRVQARAKLIAPIIVADELWGLLIAHQCFEPRRWQEKEQVFLKQIAEHLAVAINQAQLYAELQQQKQTLEERVIERTQELYDALIAAQAASRTKSEFLSTMSHELRTPLTCVIGMSSTLLRWSFGQLNQKQRSYLQTIHDSGEHLLNLINDILDLSQVEAGKTVLNITEFSLSQLAVSVAQPFKEKAQSFEVELEVELRIEREQDLFKADQRRVKQIVYNLLSNAVKFTPAGGKVILRVWLENNAAIFQVEDTGIGIPESQRPLLFQKFQQLDTSYHRKYGGTGLGLALTKQLIELHGGWIEVESIVDIGSTFTVCLPSQTINTNTIPLDVPVEHFPHGLIILIQGDEETATMLCDILTTADYQVVWMIEGSTALEQIEFLQPTTIIIDTALPGLDSYEIIQNLRQNPATEKIKILLLTDLENLQNSAEDFVANADDYLTKPFQPQEVLYKMAALSIS